MPIYSIRGLINFLKRKGMNESELLAHLKTTPQALADDTTRFTEQEHLSLFHFAQNKLGINNLGFEHGKYLQPGEWGLLGHIVMACENLYQAMALQRRYQCLTTSSGEAYHEENELETTMRWLSSPNTPNQFIEQVITAWVAFAFNHTITEQKPKALHFVHSAEADVKEYEDFFGCPVYFDSQFNGVVIHTSSLTLPLVNANKDVLAVLCNHAEVQLAEKKAMASLNVIRQFIIEQLPSGVPSLAEIAEHLGISVRQVQRKFQKEQTNLTEVLEQIRKNQAIAYLTQTDHKLMYVATVLGYSEQSAFQRAFKRWTGQTPQAFRQSPVSIKTNR
jgi:AraC-like DNA-binding protein